MFRARENCVVRTQRFADIAIDAGIGDHQRHEDTEVLLAVLIPVPQGPHDIGMNKAGNIAAEIRDFPHQA